jgi:hypothetical protein
MIAHLGTGTFLAKASNVVLLGPPGTGKTHLAIGLAVRAAQSIASPSPPPWIGSPASRPPTTPGACRLNWSNLRRIGLLVVDEVGYIPFEQDAANLFFQLVPSRYEHASVILTSHLPFARWGDVFGDQVVAAAMIDRIVHHADVLTLKGSSYRLKDTGIDTLPSARADNTANSHTTTWPTFHRRFCLVFDRRQHRELKTREPGGQDIADPEPSWRCSKSRTIGPARGLASNRVKDSRC